MLTTRQQLIEEKRAVVITSLTHTALTFGDHIYVLHFKNELCLLHKSGKYCDVANRGVERAVKSYPKQASNSPLLVFVKWDGEEEPARHIVDRLGLTLDPSEPYLVVTSLEGIGWREARTRKQREAFQLEPPTLT